MSQSRASGWYFDNHLSLSVATIGATPTYTVAPGAHHNAAAGPQLWRPAHTRRRQASLGAAGLLVRASHFSSHSLVDSTPLHWLRLRAV